MNKIQKDNLGFLGADYQYKLVSAFVQDKKYFEDLYNIIEPNAFTESCLRGIVGVMKDYYDKSGNVPSYDTILIEVRSKLVNTEEDNEYYNETVDQLKSISCEAREEIEALGMKFFKQQGVIKAAQEMLQKVKNGASIDELEVSQQEIADVLNIKRHDSNISSPLDNIEDDLSKENIVTIPTGVDLLDEALGGGLDKGKLGLIICPTGVGKTSMTTCFAANAACYTCEQNNYEGYKVLQIIFEDSHRDIHRKYFGNISGIESAEINVSEENTEKVRLALKTSSRSEFINNNIRIERFDSGEKTATDIKNEIKRITNEGFKPDMVIIDYFECLAPEPGYSKLDVTEREAKTMRKLENMAVELDIAIWVPTQGNRESMSALLITTDKMGGSIKKGQIAQVILTVAKTPEQKKANKATISLQKNRGGKDTINLEGVNFNNGTCIIDCSEVIEFDSVLEYNSEATFKEDQIKQNYTKELRAPYKLNQK